MLYHWLIGLSHSLLPIISIQMQTDQLRLHHIRKMQDTFLLCSRVNMREIRNQLIVQCMLILDIRIFCYDPHHDINIGLL